MLLGLLLVLCLGSSSLAAPAWVVGGGDTAQAHGIQAQEGFIRYGFTSSPEPGFQALPQAQDGLYCAALAGTGLLAGGNFDGLYQHQGVFEVPALYLAYFNGDQWCALKQTVNEEVHAIDCPDSNNCYVVGDFDNVIGVGGEGSRSANRLAHFRFSPEDNEWSWVNDTYWTETAEARSAADWEWASKLVVREYDDERYFFLITWSEEGDDEETSIWRGSAVTETWELLLNISSDQGYLNDFIIDSDDIIYVTGTVYLNSEQTADHDLESLTWGEPTFTNVSTCYSIVASTPSIRYLSCAWDNDPYNMYHRVMMSSDDGFAMVGLPYATDDDDEWVYIGLLNDMPLIWGDVWGFNGLPNVEDDRYPVSLDYIPSIAAWAGDKWYRPFGGGFDEEPYIVLGPTGTDNYWYFFGDFTMGFDLATFGGAWYDDSVSSIRPWFPLLYQWPSTRMDSSPALGEVHAAVFDPSSDKVYVGGQFDYLGQTRFGSVVHFTPASKFSDWNPVSSGSGLWLTSDDPIEYLRAGYVYELSFHPTQTSYLFAGGYFSRSASGNCLSNIAMLDTVSVGAEWVDVEGGCNGVVRVMEWWDGYLYIGGEFGSCGGRRTNNVAVWDGENWSGLGLGVDGAVYSMVVWNKRLVVGGEFRKAGGVYALNVAAWDGSRWTPLANKCDAKDCQVRVNVELQVNPATVVALEIHPLTDKLYALGKYYANSPFDMSFEDAEDAFCSDCQEFPLKNYFFGLSDYDGTMWRHLGLAGELLGSAGQVRDTKRGTNGEMSTPKMGIAANGTSLVVPLRNGPGWFIWADDTPVYKGLVHYDVKTKNFKLPHLQQNFFPNMYSAAGRGPWEFIVKRN